MKFFAVELSKRRAPSRGVRTLLTLKPLSLALGVATIGLIVVLNATFVCGETTFREYREIYPTYPFFDPNPVPQFTDFYPYFRFDGFSDRPEEKEWKVVELSNDYLTLKILPEIGGKIWTATEKSTGKSFFYSNPVVKFRDIAMRGPWTSGGLETNVGIIGHTPNCSSPVDYFVRSNADGSVSCFIGALDLITQSRWTVEINLPDDKAIFSTRIFWQNVSGLNQPYYTWANVGAKAADDLRFVNPGTGFVGHDGELGDWPVDSKSGKDVSLYRNNDFGGYKSYHIIGRLADFFGAYYEDEDFGVASIIPIEGKRGRKVWIWGLSREGMIWENLLTDPPAGQYIEIQTGRLFNQTSAASSRTPFKHREFAPGSSDSWIEYWTPILGTKGFQAASLTGAINVSTENDSVQIRLCPVEFLDSELKIFEGDRLLATKSVSLEPMKTIEWTKTVAELQDAKIRTQQESRSTEKAVADSNSDNAADVSGEIDLSKLRVVLGDDLLVFDADDSKNVIDDRPWSPELNPVSENSPTYRYLSALEFVRQRKYKDADDSYRKCLELDPLYLDAFVGLAENAFRRADYEKSIDYCRKALSLDLYNGGANYWLGKSQAALERWTNAKEAFAVAVLIDSYRSVAFTELARIYLRENNEPRALETIEQALDANRRNVVALRLKLCALRASKTAAANQEFERLATELLERDPLDHFVRFELYLTGRETPESVCDSIRWELPHETFLEIALFYWRIGRNDDAISALTLASQKEGINKTETLYWLAWLNRDPGRLSAAESESSDFVFPFRRESLPVFEWANENGSSWKNAYYLAILETFLERPERARELLDGCGDRPDVAAFYAFRGASSEKNRLADYRKALELEPNQTRYAIALATELQKQGKSDEAFAIVEDYSRRFPLNAKLVLLYAQGLTTRNRSEESFEFLKKAVFLPSEGSLLGRDVYHEAALTAATLKFATEDWASVLDLATAAKEWPENLGSGKPYPEYCDERLEDFLIALAAKKLGRPDEAAIALNRILVDEASETNGDDNSSTATTDRPIDREIQRQTFEKNPWNRLLTALALRESGEAAKGRELLEKAARNDSLDEASRNRARWSLEYFDGKETSAAGDSLTEKVLEKIRRR